MPAARRPLATLACLLATLGLGACGEGLRIHDLDARVIIPRDVATAEWVGLRRGTNAMTGLETVSTEAFTRTGLVNIGPVYAGLYADIRYDIETYPYPERGPAFETDINLEGDAYPYGGTTIGDFRFGCLPALRCRLVSGRFEDYDAIVDWFADDLGTPLRDAFGNDVTTGEFMKQSCYQLLDVTEDVEVRVTAYEDVNGDGEIDAGDLDFVEDENGDFVAEFRIWQQEFVEGFKLWAFMDAPSGADGTTQGTDIDTDVDGISGAVLTTTPYQFTTCNPNDGRLLTEYTNFYQAGIPQTQVLNRPGQWLDDGDYVASRGFTWNSPHEIAEVTIDFAIGFDDVTAIDPDPAVPGAAGDDTATDTGGAE